MLLFHADQFVSALNTLALAEILLQGRPGFLQERANVEYLTRKAQRLAEQLEELDLPVSKKQADNLIFALGRDPANDPETNQRFVRDLMEQLRKRIQDEIEQRRFYYISQHVEKLERDAPLFGREVEGAFPSAIYDINEAGACLALRRPTACVMHLMRTLETGLACLAGVLGINFTSANWNQILDQIEQEIRSRTQATHGPQWKNVEEPFYKGAATHFRLVKDAWRNHAQHARVKYTEEEAEEIYSSVRSFMRHLSDRLSEGGASSGQSSP